MGQNPLRTRLISEFAHQWSAVDILRQLTDHPLDLNEHSMDTSIRFGAPPDAHIHLILPQRLHLSAKTRVFIDFLVGRFADYRSEDESGTATW